MVVLGLVHVGDVNTDIVMTIEETISGANVIVDFSTNPTTSLQILVFDPDGNLEVTLAASLVNSPGSDGKIHAINTSAATFDESGAWTAKAKITFSDGTINTSNSITFEVLAND